MEYIQQNIILKIFDRKPLESELIWEIINVALYQHFYHLRDFSRVMQISQIFPLEKKMYV